MAEQACPLLSCCFTPLVLPVSFYPPVTYNNFYDKRGKMRKDHPKKKGKVAVVYLFVLNVDPTKTYVGQTSNLLGRTANYLNKSFLMSKKNANAPFIKALLKYGPAAFTLHILEYVKPEDLGTREIHYIGMLHPYYNASAGGTSGSTGYKHTVETKALLSAMRLGTIQTAATRAKISASMTGEANHFKGQTHSAEARRLNALAHSHGMV